MKIFTKEEQKEKKRIYDIGYRYINKEKLTKDKHEWYMINRDSIIEKNITRNKIESVKNFRLKYSSPYWQKKRANKLALTILNRARSRAKQKGLEFNITEADISIPEYCPILGIPIILSKGKASRGSPALDRKDNSKGYIKENVFIISHKANIIKSDLSLEQAKALVKYMEA